MQGGEVVHLYSQLKTSTRRRALVAGEHYLGRLGLANHKYTLETLSGDRLNRQLIPPLHMHAFLSVFTISITDPWPPVMTFFPLRVSHSPQILGSRAPVS
jgi:hypothetical protein